MFKFIDRLKEIFRIVRTCHKYNIKKYTINPDNSVDVDGNVWMNSSRLDKIPLKFRNVTGGFYCYNNRLTSFENFPISIGGSLECHSNRISSLRGFPEFIGGGVNLFYRKNSLYPEWIFSPYLRGNGYDNPIRHIYRLNPCKEFIEMLNEYDVIRDDNRVVETRLRQALEDSGRKIHYTITIPEYTLI